MQNRSSLNEDNDKTTYGVFVHVDLTHRQVSLRTLVSLYIACLCINTKLINEPQKSEKSQEKRDHATHTPHIHEKIGKKGERRNLMSTVGKFTQQLG